MLHRAATKENVRMRPTITGAVAFTALALTAVVPAHAQPAGAASPSEQPFVAGTPLAGGPNIKTYGGFRFGESICYDATRDLYVVVNAGIAQNLIPNDGYVSLVNPDGSAHTLKWIGVNRNGLTLNHPLGSEIANGRLYVADIDTLRWFDMKTGAPMGSVTVPGALFLNDIAVAPDGTVYATQTGTEEAGTWKVYRIAPAGDVSTIITGAPLGRPNGIAFDAKGNLVVVNMLHNDVQTFSTSGQLLTSVKTTDEGNDGIVVLKDGTMYVSSVRAGTVARIRPGQPAERIASGIPSAASMTWDSKRNRLVIPMNDWNAITFVELR
jgi:DNA-binding beta-propeller fold protein YncE